MLSASIDHNGVLERMQRESDRTAVILGGAVLDELLKQLLAARFVSLQAKLLAEGGALWSFAARIRITRALDWINNDVYADLERIRKLRNLCAHSVDAAVSLSDTEPARICSGIAIVARYQQGLETAKIRQQARTGADVFDTVSARYSQPDQRFRFAVDLYAQHLMELQAQAAPYASIDVFAQARALGESLSFGARGTANVVDPGAP